MTDRLFDAPAGRAVISDDDRYRYVLERLWHVDEPAMCFVMLNPSRADAEQGDMTLTRCVDFARRERCGALVLVNLYAFRTPYPTELANTGDPIGPDNSRHLDEIMSSRAIARIVVGWGSGIRSLPNWRIALGEFMLTAARHHRTLECLGTSKDGSPRHPSRLAGNTPLVTWEVPQWASEAVSLHADALRQKRSRRSMS